MRIALAVLMALHGMAHLVGFTGSFQLASPGTIPYKTTILAGKLDIGGPGVRTMGVFWLLTALAFLVAAGAALASWPGWVLTGLAVSLFSLLLCLIAMPDARIGAGVDFLIVAALLVGQRLELFSPIP